MPGFAFSPFGTRPFATIIDLPLPAATAAAAIAAGIIFTVDIIPVSGTPIYAATEEFATRDTDSAPNRPYSGTVEKALRFHRAIIDGSKIGGMSSGYSDIVLNNPSGEYDAYANSLDGANVIVRYGARGASFDSFVVMYRGLVDGTATVEEETLTIHLYDDNKRLDIPVQPSVYGGTGTIDGDANVKGKRKPLALGIYANATAVLIDAANLVYQIHDGAVDDTSTVYDRGVALTVDTNYSSYANLIAPGAVPAGTFGKCNSLGIFRLGAKPDGLVTASGSGAISNGLVAAAASGVAMSDAARLVHYLITISSANIVVDTGSIISVAVAQGAAIGYVVGPDENKTLRTAIDELTNGILGWAGFRRDRTFEIGLIALPGSVYAADYTDKDYFSIKQLPLPSGMSPPPYRIRAAYSRNWTQQPEIDATISASTQTLRKDPYSIAVSTDAVTSDAILAAHPQAQDIDVWPSYFVNSADAVTFCNAVLVLFGGATRSLIEIVVPADGYALNLNNPIRVTDDRYGLSGGRAGAIVSIDDDTSKEQAIVQMVA